MLLEEEEVKATVAVAASGLSIEEEAAVTEEEEAIGVEVMMGALSNPANGSSVPV